MADKSQTSSKEQKKAPKLSLKEKRALKREKQASRHY